MVALGIVELEGSCESIEHGLRCARESAALEPGVVIDADTGEEGDLLAPEARDASCGDSVRAQARLFRRDPRSPGGEERAGLVPCVHVTSVAPCA